MTTLIAAMCWLILATGLVPAFAQPAEEAYEKLQGKRQRGEPTGQHPVTPESQLR